MKKFFVALLSLVIILTSFVSVTGEEYLPSPSLASPRLVPIEYEEDGIIKFAYGLIIDQNDKVQVPLDYMDIYLTPYAEKDKSKYPIIKEILEKSYSEILDADSDPVELAEKIREALPKHEGFTETNIYISELFDVSIFSNGKIIEVPKGCHLVFRVSVDFDKDEDFIILHNIASKEWIVEEDVIYVEDEEKGNYLEFSVDSLSSIVIVRKGEEKAVSSNCILNFNGFCFGWLFLITSFVELIVIIYLLKKKHEDNIDKELRGSNEKK